jgi:hypothetical protein
MEVRRGSASRSRTSLPNRQAATVARVIGKEQSGVTATIGGAGCLIAATSARANPAECADFFSLDLNTIG